MLYLLAADIIIILKVIYLDHLIISFDYLFILLNLAFSYCIL